MKHLHQSSYLLNSMRILHASTFSDIHLCGVNTSRLEKKHIITDYYNTGDFKSCILGV